MTNETYLSNLDKHFKKVFVRVHFQDNYSNILLKNHAGCGKIIISLITLQWKGVNQDKYCCHDKEGS